MIKQGAHVYFAFSNGESVLDSRNKPRMYLSVAQFEKHCPGRAYEQIELIEYAPVIHAQWADRIIGDSCKHRCCTNCGFGKQDYNYAICPGCGAIMDNGKTNPESIVLTIPASALCAVRTTHACKVFPPAGVNDWTVRCSRCEGAVNATAKFCESCGSLLDLPSEHRRLNDNRKDGKG